MTGIDKAKTVKKEEKGEQKMKNRTLSFLGVTIVVLMALALAMPAAAAEKGNILRVGPGQEYETIQSAVDAAKQGSKILVYPDLYVENVLITKNNLQIIAQCDGVTVEATPPPPYDANASGVFHVLADHVTIRGFEILYGARCAPGIEFQGSHNTFAENNIYLGATCLGANAIVCRDGDGGSDYNTIEHNYIDQADLGIVISALGKHDEYTPGAINTGNVIRNNTTNSIGALAIGVENGNGFLVSGNSIPSVGDGICIAIGTNGEDASAQGHHSIVNNTMGHCAGNGISLYAYPGTVLTHNRISDNTIQLCGSDCIALEAGTGAVLTDNQVTGNEVSFSKACGITLGAYGLDQDVSVSNNLVRGNTVYHNRSGICLNPGAKSNRVFKNVTETNLADGIAVFGESNSLMGNTSWRNGGITDGYNGGGIGIVVKPGGANNRIFNNTALENGTFDLADDGTDNRWWNNEYEIANW